MNDTLRPDMLEAARLTRTGRLVEATELLQRLLQGEAVAADITSVTICDTVNAHGASGARIIELAPKTVEATGPQPSWRTRKTFWTDANNPPADSVEGAAQPHMPEALRTFIERINRIGPETAVPGLLKRSPAHAPDLVPDGGQFVDGVYGNQAGTRAYKLYIPSGYRGEALPLVVMLHGCTQSPDDFAAGTRMNVLAEEHTCFVAYPAQAASANPSKCWNWFSPSDQHRGAGEPSLISGITRQIMRDYSVDPRRVYVAGLSAGAAAAAIMGMTYPDLYAAIGVHSGLACGSASDLPSAFAAMRQGGPTALDVHSSSAWGGGEEQWVIPIIVFHGDQDTTVHPRNGDLVIDQSRSTTTTDLHTRVELGRVPGGHSYSRTLYVDASGQAILEQWVVHGAGHAWSGGSPAGSFTDPRGPDAAREMLRFFFDHSHPAATRLI